MTSRLIVCRARVSNACLHGLATFKQFGEDLPMSADGTYHQSIGSYTPEPGYDGDGSIVCDACYGALGHPLNSVMTAVITDAWSDRLRLRLDPERGERELAHWSCGSWRSPAPERQSPVEACPGCARELTVVLNWLGVARPTYAPLAFTEDR